jgi:hypothetical protein
MLIYYQYIRTEKRRVPFEVGTLVNVELMVRASTGAETKAGDVVRKGREGEEKRNNRREGKERSLQRPWMS